MLCRYNTDVVASKRTNTAHKLLECHERRHVSHWQSRYLRPWTCP
jgi:hypothetical protein